ncbi:MBOAT family protein, partial [Turicibacter sanguinis]|nr:MBOAT family protein [Turicibacter sanguinis]
FIFHLNLQPFNLPLPIGISFYTFQSMSYTIDVYRGRVKVQESFLRLATYVALFPQLIAGPIVRYSTIEKELSSRQETLENVSNGLRRFIVGLMKKVLISNKLGLLATQIQVLHQNELSLIISWIGIIAYALHIYYDFSGYSDMAIGLGKMFGFHFLENFNYPYISKSMTEFWRRWHISLGSWFRDYVYIPLGGNRGTVLKHIRNILIVWFLTGFWHGASWNFILWGLYFGVILIIEKYVLLKWLERLPSLIQHIYAIVLFLIGWVIFSFTNLVQLGAYLKSMFDFKVLMKWDIFLMLDIQYYWPYLVVGLVGATPLIAKLARKFLKQGEVTKLIGDLGLGMLFVLCVMSLLDSTFNPFIYFRF